MKTETATRDGAHPGPNPHLGAHHVALGTFVAQLKNDMADAEHFCHEQDVARDKNAQVEEQGDGLVQKAEDVVTGLDGISKLGQARPVLWRDAGRLEKELNARRGKPRRKEG